MLYDLVMDNIKSQKSLFDYVTQITLPVLTLSGFLLTSLKRPQIGLILNLSGQIFWLYSGWKAWRQAGQIGLFVTTVVTTLILIGGVVNYWLL